MENLLPIVTKFCGESIGPDNVITIFVGEDDFAQRTEIEQKSIILIGCQKSGKAEIIDSFCNLFYGISFNSPIRYKIANERFDSSSIKNDIKIIKYVFYGTKYSFIPVIIDIPDIQKFGPTSTFPILHQFLNYDLNAQIHALVIILPTNISSFNPQIQNEYQKLLSLFNPALKESCFLITNNTEDVETDFSAFLLQQIGIIPFKTFYTNTSSIFVKPSLDAVIRKRQKKYFALTIQNLSLLTAHLGILSPQVIACPSMPLQQRPAFVLDNSLHQLFQSLPPQLPRPASIVQNRIPPTIRENVSTTSSTLESSDISASRFRTRPERLFEIETNPIIKDSYLSEHASDPPRSQLTHSAVLIPDQDSTANRQNKQYLYDPETRTYQMSYGYQVPPSQPAATIFPVLESTSLTNKIQKTDVREEMAKLLRRVSFEDAEGTPTDSSEDSSEIIQRGGVESARSTASNWQYTPSSHGTIDKLQHASTYIDGSPERPLIKNASATPSQVEGFDYATLEMLKYEDPPKPGRAVDLKFEQQGFNRSPFRQTRRQLPYSHEIKSYPPKDVEIYIPQPEQPLLTAGYPKPSKQITFQMDEDTDDRSSSGNFDDSKCCFYILAPPNCSCGKGEWFGDEGEIIYSNRNLVKIWLHDSLSVNKCNISSTELSYIIPKLAKCDLRDVWIYNQNLTFEEYQFFTSSSTIELLYFGELCTIKYSDDAFVTFDKLLKNLPNIKTFIYFNVNPSMFEPDTVKKMVEILRQFKELECLKLFHLVETFDISSITDYLLENQTAEIVLYFKGGFSDAFKLELNKCFQKIVKNPPKILTKIIYPGMDEIQFEEYKKLYQ